MHSARRFPLSRCASIVVARVLALTSAAIGAATPALAQESCYYTWERIHLPDLGLAGYGLNNLGHVAGTVYSIGDNTSAFLWTPEDGVGFLPFPPGIISMEAYAINDFGQIAGKMNSATQYFGFVWQQGVGYTVLTPPSPYASMYVTDINNNGEVVGSVYRRVIPGPWHWEPFVWQNGQFTFLGDVLGFNTAFARGISEDGRIAGYVNLPEARTQGFVVVNRSLVHWFVAPAGIGSTRGQDVNSTGLVVGDGVATADNRLRAIVWTPSGAEVIEPMANSDRTYFRHISEVGRAIGTFDGVFTHPFVWQFGHVTDLLGMLEPYISPAFLSEGLAINDVGQVSAAPGLLFPVFPQGDIDSDCEVGLVDLALLLTDFGSSSGRILPGDVNFDGTVDLTDLSIVLINFGSFG